MTHSEIRKYFKIHRDIKLRILGPNFKWQAVFGAISTAREGTFTLSEFVIFVLKHEHDTRSRAFAARVFNAADKNKDGELTHSELRKYCKAEPDVKLRLLGADFAWQSIFGVIDSGECQWISRCIYIYILAVALVLALSLSRYAEYSPDPISLPLS